MAAVTRCLWVSHGRHTSDGRGRQGRRATGHHFLAAGFAFSCLGFLFFLSFFWELLPLTMIVILRRSQAVTDTG